MVYSRTKWTRRASNSEVLRFWPLFLLMTAIFPNAANAEYHENVEYGQANGQSLRMDVHIPEGPGPFPAAVIVHGGAWVMGDKQYNVKPLFRPLSEARFAWFSIGYRLAGNGINRENFAQGALESALTLGEAVDDVRNAVAYIKSHAAGFRVNPERLALVGESAGAQLAAMAALRPGPEGPIRAVVAFYIPSDLVSLAETSKHIPDSVRQSLKGTPWEAMITAGLRNLSPVNFVSGDAPPFLLIHGTSDNLVPFTQSEEMKAKLEDAGARCTLFPVAGGDHGILWWEHLHLTAYKKRMIDWLEQELR